MASIRGEKKRVKKLMTDQLRELLSIEVRNADDLFRYESIFYFVNLLRRRLLWLKKRRSKAYRLTIAKTKGIINEYNQKHPDMKPG